MKNEKEPTKNVLLFFFFVGKKDTPPIFYFYFLVGEDSNTSHLLVLHKKEVPSIEPLTI